MTARSKSEIKALFEDGDMPTGQNFADLIDSFPGENGRLSYAIYRAILNQSGEVAPVAAVLENNLGGVVVWTRDGAGSYLGTLAGAFPAAKTFVLFKGYTGDHAYSSEAIRITDDEIGVTAWLIATDAGADNSITNAMLEVLVYP
jgi:hypothetical protein